MGGSEINIRMKGRTKREEAETFCIVASALVPHSTSCVMNLPWLLASSFAFGFCDRFFIFQIVDIIRHEEEMI